MSEYLKAKDIFIQRRTSTNEGFEEYPLIVQPSSVLTTDANNNLTATALAELTTVSSSYAVTASFAINFVANDPSISSSWASSSVSASFADYAPIAESATSAAIATNAINAATASVLNGTASWAVSASWAPQGTFTQSIQTSCSWASRSFDLNNGNAIIDTNGNAWFVGNVSASVVTSSLLMGKVQAQIATATFATTTSLDFNGLSYQTLTLTGDTYFTGSNYDTGRMVNLKVYASGSDRFTYFPSNWIGVGNAAPVSMSAGKTGIFCFTCYGPTDDDIVFANVIQP